MKWVFESIQSLQVQLEFTTLHWDGCNFGGLYLFHQMTIFNKICWIFFPIKSTYCGKIFKSIQVFLNAWEQFEVQNPNIFALQWTLAAYNFFRQGLFSIIFVGKVVHTSLVRVVKISCQYKKLWLIKIILVEVVSVIDVFFSYFFTVFWHFKAILQTQWVNWMIFFPPKYFSFGFESLCSLNFFHLSRFRNQISPPNVFRQISAPFFNTKTL